MKKWLYLVLSLHLLMASSPTFGVAKQYVSAREGAKGVITPPVPAKNLKINTPGIKKIKSHLSKLDIDAANDAMVSRLEKIAKGEMQATVTDLNFYAHELREMELMSKGMSYKAAHVQALKDYGIEYIRDFEKHLYTPEALKAGDNAFLNGN